MRPGQAVRCELSKWGDRPHWSYDATWLGSDEHGDWIGCPIGTMFERPGRTFVAPNNQVTLVPSVATPSTDERPWWLATFHDTGGLPWPRLDGDRAALYVDMTTPAHWEGSTLRAVDLDLDVVKGVGGLVIVDDEDEFAEHQVELGYPDDVITGARSSCRAVFWAASSAAAPFDGSHLAWLRVLREVSASSEP